MSIPVSRGAWLFPALSCLSAALGGCAGNGMGLDMNGNPLAAGSSAPAALSADFQSIQDNVFTPICTRCHLGADAPEGLQLDQAHSYALLVGVPSAEVPSLDRVKPGDPADSYLIKKLEGASGIVGAQMPFGGPYLPQSTLDVIQQWITNGAAPAATSGGATLALSASDPVDHAQVDAPLSRIAIGFSQRPDPGFLHGAVHLEQIDAAAAATVPVLLSPAEGNPATLVLTPLAPLGPGHYRLTLHGGDAAALTSVDGEALAQDFSLSFTVGAP